MNAKTSLSSSLSDDSTVPTAPCAIARSTKGDSPAPTASCKYELDIRALQTEASHEKMHIHGRSSVCESG